ncbi:patatin [Halioglobus maricola]|uniref:Patatin n=1 Tax=Halioglobus maricola TaxID=2601894 RepID=A0A5P9NKK0_9GAMM|nr:patatin-like phospholipase family protein [Halioglobus maricola]QFU76297.1 patatin [Halioglobus maricola]
MRADPNRLIFLLALFVLAGCSSIARNPLPEEQHLQASVLGRNDLRFWGDELDADRLSWLTKESDVSKEFPGIINRQHDYLVLSGGGANGSYGAGLLVGWTDAGSRPEFTIVTGISIGALTAPFAFLGSDYDPVLTEIYTTLDSSSIFEFRSVFRVLGQDSLANTAPMQRTLETYVDDDVIEALAREYHRGRRLQIGTTNLDAGRSVVWDVTRIAATGHPEAKSLIHQVLMASAALPGLFPPVYIDVEAPDGSRYDEMHVDGGTTAQMFFYPNNVDWGQVTERLNVQGTPTIYVIRNSRVRPDYKTVPPRMSAIGGRTINSLIRTQGIGDYYRILALAERDGLDLEISWIPRSAASDVETDEPFDPEMMRALYHFGYKRMIEGSAWKNPRETGGVLERSN